MTAFDKLVEIFRTFPGVGPRQAKRFAYHLVRSSSSLTTELATATQAVKKEVRQCTSCQRFFSGNTTLCTICSDTSRDSGLLMIIAHDTDLESIEKSKTYTGYYFVLGGLLSLTDDETNIRTRELTQIINDRKNTLKEVIIALSVTAEGDHTTEYIHKILNPLLEGVSVTITVLGRGFSTGSELEYADSETIKHAFSGRKSI